MINHMNVSVNMNKCTLLVMYELSAGLYLIHRERSIPDKLFV